VKAPPAAFVVEVFICNGEKMTRIFRKAPGLLVFRHVSILEVLGGLALGIVIAVQSRDESEPG
jgi:hypothetical protein